MGSIVDVTCKSCKAHWKCRTGCGFMYGELENVVDLFPEEIEKDILARTGQMKFPLFDFTYQLSYCPQCGSIESIPTLKLLEDDIVYMGTCPVCGQKVKLIGDISQAVCPVCHKATLEERNAGFWD